MSPLSIHLAQIAAVWLKLVLRGVAGVIIVLQDASLKQAAGVGW